MEEIDEKEIKNEKQEVKKAKELDIIKILKDGEKVEFDDKYRANKDFLGFLQKKSEEVLKGEKIHIGGDKKEKQMEENKNEMNIREENGNKINEMIEDGEENKINENNEKLDETESASALVFVRGGKRGETIIQYEILLDAKETGEYNLKTLEDGLVGLINEYYDLRYNKQEKVLRMEMGIIVKPSSVMKEINKYEETNVDGKSLAKKIAPRTKGDYKKNKKNVYIIFQDYKPKGCYIIGHNTYKRKGVKIYELGCQGRYEYIVNSAIFKVDDNFIKDPSAEDINKASDKFDKIMEGQLTLSIYKNVSDFCTSIEKMKTVCAIKEHFEKILPSILGNYVEYSKISKVCSKIDTVCAQLISVINFVHRDKNVQDINTKIKLTNNKNIKLHSLLRALLFNYVDDLEKILQHNGIKFDKFKRDYGLLSETKSAQELLKSGVTLEINGLYLSEIVVNQNNINDNKFNNVNYIKGKDEFQK